MTYMQLHVADAKHGKTSEWFWFWFSLDKESQSIHCNWYKANLSTRKLHVFFNTQMKTALNNSCNYHLASTCTCTMLTGITYWVTLMQVYKVKVSTCKSGYEPSGPSGWSISNWEGNFYSPLDGMLVHHQVTSSIKSSLVPICTSGWREALWARVKCLAQEHNIMSPGLELGPLDLVPSWLVCLSPCLPSIWIALIK